MGGSTDDSGLAADIYKAAIDQRHWPALLDRVASSVGARGAAILSTDCAEGGRYLVPHVCSLYDPERVEFYIRYLAHHENEVLALAEASDAGVPVRDPGFDENPMTIRKRPDVDFCLKHFGVLYRLGMRVNDDRGWFTSVTCQFTEVHGEASPREVRRLQSLRPHLAQAFQMARGFQLLRERYAAVLGVLDRLRVATFVLTDASRIVICNATARDLLASERVLIVSPGGSLVVRDLVVASRFSASVDAALQTARQRGDCARALLGLPDRSAAATCIAEVSPLQDVDRELGDLVSGVLVTVIDPELRASIDLSGMDFAYGLTTTESAIARLLCDGLTYREIADSRNVSPETVKSQVRSLLQKTNSRNRSELVRLAMLLNVPVDPTR